MTRNLLSLLFVGLWAVAACQDYDLANGDDDTTADDDDDAVGDDDTDPYGDDDDTEDPLAGIPIGRVVTILLTLNDAWMDPAISSQLLLNAVEWSAPQGVTDPAVLIIRDDDHSEEHPEDSEHIRDTLVAAGYNAVLIEEPANGIDQSALVGYHVAILSNPGHSPDDLATLEWLYDFSSEGFGIIFQGDDMGHFDDGSFDMALLTRLTYIDNGTEYYGHPIDNDQADSYEVILETTGHPVLSGIEGEVFLYGDDIDTTESAQEGEAVLAQGTVYDTQYPLKPVVAAYSSW